MKLTCTHCAKTFRISAEQLGTRGKCPHCRKTIILPRAANRFVDSDELQPPDLWTERWFSVLGTGLLHAVLLALLALLPSRYARSSPSGKGMAVTIGTAPQLNTSSPSPSRESPRRISANSSQRIIDTLAEQPLASSSELSSEELTALLLPAAGQTGEQQENDETVFRGKDETGEDFATLVARLQQDGLEIVITFDSTGSMEGEIRQVKARIQRMGSALMQVIPKTRISICTYRDHDARYLVQGLPLTDDLDKIVSFLDKIDAAGGGDDPEAVQAGLDWAIHENRFRQRARKVILLFGDSPPHRGDLTECLRLATTFRRRSGGVISTVTCHSNSRLTEFIEIAQLGGGEAFLARDEKEIMTELLVLVFGSQHRDKVLEAFDLMHR